ncbi:MAG: Stp1/IreP family PP2C-type Ser/Thr phosphatase [Bacillota bacterium]|nr:Stp1/IreP family PP2C-type Ser/Thr phosphatase [Bacillota bacterium]
MLGALSDVGNVRQLNEDYMAYFEDEVVSVYLIADGMGGHNAGEIASALAAEKVIEYIKKHKEEEELKELIRNSIMYANRAVFDKSEGSYSLKGMGTTITVYISNGEKCMVANVGDSCCYIIRDDELSKVTKDHSLVQQLIDEGSITEAEARRHPNKNIITRALGTGEDVVVDIFDLQKEGLEKVILCTDGLINDVQPEEILDCIKRNENNAEACRELIDLAKVRGGRDNITVMVIEGECSNDRNHIKQQI